MDLKTWEKIRDECKKAHPLARIRKLHPIIQNPKILKKIRDEARELAKKARLELDSEHFWKWGGVSLLPSRRAPQLEEQIREERPKKSLEQTVEAAAPTKPKEEQKMDMKYGASEGGYVAQDYSTETYRREHGEQEEHKKPSEATKTASERLTETKYHRKAKKASY